MKSIAIKLALILILPLEISSSSSTIVYISILFQLNPSDSAMSFTGNADPLFVLGFFTFMVTPALVFNYRQYQAPGGKSVGLSFLLVFVYTQSISQALLLLPIIVLFLTEYNMHTINDSSLLSILTTPWALLLLIVMPYFQREMRATTTEDSRKIQKWRGLVETSRYSICGNLMAVAVCMFPLFLRIFMSRYIDAEVVSGAMISGIGVFRVYIHGDYRFFLFSVYELTYFHGIMGVLLLYTAYAKQVLKFLKGTVTRSRTILFGIAVTLASWVVITSLPMGYSYDSILIPLPFVLILGVLIVVFVEPRKVKNELWDDVPHRMWFQPAIPASEEYEVDRVKIPLSYILRSKLTRSREKKIVYDWKKKDEDIFRDDTQHQNGKSSNGT